MDAETRQHCRNSYDRVAHEYARRIFDELQHKPLDRELLDQFAAAVRDVGPACDMGCGPGHVARYLHERGVDVCGVDLSAEMIAQARRLVPGVAFRPGDMLRLEEPDETWAGIVAFYSLIHIPRSDMSQALGELRRALRPGGVLLVAFHIGDDTVHRDELWGTAVHLDFLVFHSDEMASLLRAAGFTIDAVVEREPYPDIEHQSRRGYIFARKPGSREWTDLALASGPT